MPYTYEYVVYSWRKASTYDLVNFVYEYKL